MRHTEFWARMERALGRPLYRSWADSVVLVDLASRTVDEALEAGVPPKQVWAAVWKHLELPGAER